MIFEPLTSRSTLLGSLTITRALPGRGRRLVGPWCFLDRFGPLRFAEGTPMDVGPHPHIGIQTVSWLLDGEILHHDSLGYEALVLAGGVNVMTSGAGISHSEESPRINSGLLNGVQLWVALPDQHRQTAAALDHVDQVPAGEVDGGLVRVFAGSLAGLVSPAKYFSEIVGAEVQVHPQGAPTLELQSAHEHAIMLLSGDCTADGQPLQENVLYFLGDGRSAVELNSSSGARLILIGGAPFTETIFMWWNFVARTRAEIAEARENWETHHSRFGEVKAYKGPRVPAPSFELVASK